MENNPIPPQNNQPTQNYTVLPPSQGQMPPEPSGPQNKLRDALGQPKRVIPVLLGLIMLVVGGMLLMRSDEKNNGIGDAGAGGQTSFRNWLEPTSEIKIGDNRYESTCQVLPVSTVIEAMYDGKPPANFAVGEEYYDGSPAQVQFTKPQTQCQYGDAVNLSAEHYYEAADTKILASAIYSRGDEYIESKVAAYKKAVESSGDESLKSFVAQIESSSQTFLKYKDEYSRKATADLDTSTLIIPIGTNAVEFNLFADNIIYQLTLPSKLRASAIAEAPAEQLLTQLKQAKKLTDAIRENSNNPKLSQSPAPTVLGDRAKLGDTYILEPCAVLSPQIMQSITGANQANLIERRSVVYDLSEPVTARSGYAVFPSNDCTRNVSLPQGDKTVKTIVKLDIEHAPDAAALDKKLTDAKFTALDADDTKLQTAADFAAEYVVGSVQPFYQFRTGNYWMYLTISTIEPVSGVQGQGTREQHIAAINLLVESIKANAKEAERTEGR
jgi:hypothetical protein